MNFVAEMKWRNMINDFTPGIEEELMSNLSTGYVGFDPTASSLHIGSLAPIMLLMHLQRSGHKPIALLGGATAMIGDPSGKKSERKLLSQDEVHANLISVKKQLELFLDFDCGQNSAEIVNNLDWISKFSIVNFLRDFGKSLTVNYMMAKDSVKNRIETGISFTEFSYQLIQAYDFFHLYKTKNCKIQIGGSDQWGNITSGIELIKKQNVGKAYALTCPLVTKADGAKFGKTEEGNIWLDPNRTSPYKFLQYWMNISDDDSKKYIKIFSLLNKQEIEDLIINHDKEPHMRIIQRQLAKEITSRVHGSTIYSNALKVSQILFGKDTQEELKNISEEDFLMIFEGVPIYNISRNDIKSIDPVNLLAEKTQVFSSKGEARRMLSSNAVSLNKKKITVDSIINTDNLLNNKYLLVQKGKKNYIIIKII
ncbi:MAG: tyrosine--tRNA ligase [Flavobacteriales bacterium]|nr:tyrosine--tRNA ligase [Flavobacteriales bacterium]